MKKVVVCLLCMVLCFGVLTGCGKRSCVLKTPEGTSVEITLGDECDYSFTETSETGFTIKGKGSNELVCSFTTKEVFDSYTEESDDIIVQFGDAYILFFDTDEDNRCFGAVVDLNDGKNALLLENKDGDRGFITNTVFYMKLVLK